jgi:hypothetical protein
MAGYNSVLIANGKSAEETESMTMFDPFHEAMQSQKKTEEHLF